MMFEDDGCRQHDDAQRGRLLVPGTPAPCVLGRQRIDQPAQLLVGLALAGSDSEITMVASEAGGPGVDGRPEILGHVARIGVRCTGAEPAALDADSWRPPASVSP